MNNLKVGVAAKVKQPELSGGITDARYNKDFREMEFFLEYVGQDGEQHSRWFRESELEPVNQEPK